MQNQRGFSLIELLIVVVIIGVVAAIAIPNFLASRRAANEGSAVSTLRTLHGANMNYAATIGNGDYAGLVSTVGTSAMAQLAGARLVDDVLGAGNKSGFLFVGDRALATGTEPQTFYFAANPEATSGLQMTGTKRFGVATDGVVRYDAAPSTLGTPFDAASLPLATPFPQ